MKNIASSNLRIDGIDKIILNALIEDARTPILEIARKLNISATAVHQRLKKLEASQVVLGSKFVLNPKVLGYETRAFIGVYLDKSIKIPDVIGEFKGIPEVVECHLLTVFLSLCQNNET